MARRTTKTASYIQRTPGVVGSRARVRNTRIAVWILVEDRRLGVSEQEMLRNYPTLTQADLDEAWRYYDQNHAEIDWDIKERNHEQIEQEQPLSTSFRKPRSPSRPVPARLRRR